MRVGLNSKAKKQVVECLTNQYGYDQKFDVVVFMHTTLKKLFLMSNTIKDIDYETLRVNSMGLYFGEYNDDETMIRLTIEGSQLIGPHAKKNVMNLSDEQIKVWLTGADVEMDDDLTAQAKGTSGYVLVKNSKDDFFGASRIKEGKMLNFVPKIRRVVVEE